MARIKFLPSIRDLGIVTQGRGCTRGSRDSTAGQLQIQQSRQTEQQFARALRQRQRQRHIRRQARRAAPAAGSRPPARRARRESRMPRRESPGPELSSSSASRQLDRVPKQPQNQIHLAGADEPADQARAGSSPPRVRCADRSRCTAGRWPRACVIHRDQSRLPRSAAAARITLAEQSAPLQPDRTPPIGSARTPLAISAAVRSAAGADMAAARPAAPRRAARKICANVCRVVLTVMAAAASGIGMPRCARWRAISTGPPIWPAGIRLLADSPTQRASTASRSGAPRRSPRRTAREWPPHRAPAAAGETAATSSRPQPASASVAKIGRQALRDEHADEQQHADDSSQLAARVMSRRACQERRNTWRKPK